MHLPACVPFGLLHIATLFTFTVRRDGCHTRVYYAPPPTFLHYIPVGSPAFGLLVGLYPTHVTTTFSWFPLPFSSTPTRIYARVTYPRLPYSVTTGREETLLAQLSCLYATPLHYLYPGSMPPALPFHFPATYIYHAAHTAAPPPAPHLRSHTRCARTPTWRDARLGYARALHLLLHTHHTAHAYTLHTPVTPPFTLRRFYAACAHHTTLPTAAPAFFLVCAAGCTLFRAFWAATRSHAGLSFFARVAAYYLYGYALGHLFYLLHTREQVAYWFCYGLHTALLPAPPLRHSRARFTRHGRYAYLFTRWFLHHLRAYRATHCLTLVRTVWLSRGLNFVRVLQRDTLRCLILVDLFAFTHYHRSRSPHYGPRYATFTAAYPLFQHTAYVGSSFAFGYAPLHLCYHPFTRPISHLPTWIIPHHTHTCYLRTPHAYTHIFRYAVAAHSGLLLDWFCSLLALAGHRPLFYPTTHYLPCLRLRYWRTIFPFPHAHPTFTAPHTPTGSTTHCCHHWCLPLPRWLGCGCLYPHHVTATVAPLRLVVRRFVPRFGCYTLPGYTTLPGVYATLLHVGLVLLVGRIYVVCLRCGWN